VSIAVITGAAGLIGSQAAMRFHELGYEIWGIDNDARAEFFGPEASTARRRAFLEQNLPRYRHFDVDIRDRQDIERMLRAGYSAISVVIHAAAQPSHDWAGFDPHADFSVNAVGTLNLLEAVRTSCPEAPFIFTSTNKVYGDYPNRLELIEHERRYDLPSDHPLYEGVDHTAPIDHSTHSLLGVSKASADLLVQEYGRYFGMPTVCFRAGCLTGPGHAGTELHGFLAYLLRCAVLGRPYTVYGHQGKQVRDNMHSADLVAAFEAFVDDPRPAAVYNIGGGRESHCSMLEAIEACEHITGRYLHWIYEDRPRSGDHKWWIGDLGPFRADYPHWKLEYDVEAILAEMHERNAAHWLEQAR
jgi:CDP-paratose 2-epimerase